jgi:hypothetical protein
MIIDLQLWIITKKEQGHDIVLMLDANEDIQNKTAVTSPVKQMGDSHHAGKGNHDGSLATLIKTCNLTDILATQHPRSQYPATYTRGTRRLDYILISQRLIPAVVRSGLM